MTNIEGDGYSVCEEGNGIAINGALRLNSMDEYKAIQDALIEFATKNNNQIEIDLTRLQLLNSSGITMLSKFVIHCRKNEIKVIMKWDQDIAWQGKSLKNLQRLMPSLELIF